MCVRVWQRGRSRESGDCDTILGKDDRNETK